MRYDWTGSGEKIVNGLKTSRKGGAAALTPVSKKTSEAGQSLAATSRIVDMKSAVKVAIAFAEEFFPGAKDLRLEEVEQDSSGWSVVVSFTTGEPELGGSETLSRIMGGLPRESRIYKTIAIDSASGQAQSLKVWKK